VRPRTARRRAPTPRRAQRPPTATPARPDPSRTPAKSQLMRSPPSTAGWPRRYHATAAGSSGSIPTSAARDADVSGAGVSGASDGPAGGGAELVGSGVGARCVVGSAPQPAAAVATTRIHAAGAPPVARDSKLTTPLGRTGTPPPVALA
jgi:hypothetical protein